MVAASGGGGANADGVLAGGQVGCNWQHGTLVLGLEGDFDYFRSKPNFSNNTNTLSDGVTPFTISQSLTTDYLATVRPRIGIGADRNFAYITGGVAFEPRQLHRELCRRHRAARRRNRGCLAISRGLDRRRRLGICLRRPLDGASRISVCGFPETSATGAIADAAGGPNALGGSSDLTIQLVRAGVNFKF